MLKRLLRPTADVPATAVLTALPLVRGALCPREVPCGAPLAQGMFAAPIGSGPRAEESGARSSGAFAGALPPAECAGLPDAWWRWLSSMPGAAARRSRP